MAHATVSTVPAEAATGHDQTPTSPSCLSCARPLPADEGEQVLIGWVQVDLCGPRCQSDLETALELSDLPCISTGCGAESVDGSQCEQHLYQAA